MADSREKQHISLVVTGHIDAGKSTTTGHLIFKLGGINARDMAKLQEKADANGKSSFAFAYYMDTNKEERERGVTVNCNTKEFYTDSYHYSIVDAPGHRDYVKNMISGAGQADAALILIPAEKGGFEAAIAKGDRATGEVEGQTRQHARLLALLGIEKVIVGINKMDSCDWSQTRFDEIKKEMSAMLQQCGMKPKKIPFIPYSGFNGDNLTEPTDKMPWYDGWMPQSNSPPTVAPMDVVEWSPHNCMLGGGDFGDEARAPGGFPRRRRRHAAARHTGGEGVAGASGIDDGFQGRRRDVVHFFFFFFFFFVVVGGVAATASLALRDDTRAVYFLRDGSGNHSFDFFSFVVVLVVFSRRLLLLLQEQLWNDLDQRFCLVLVTKKHVHDAWISFQQSQQSFSTIPNHLKRG